MELTKGVWFYEIGELAGMRTADQYSIKSFVTRQEERARPAYGYFKENQPRIAVFIGTFNTDANTGETVEYLNPGDRRRWWPVRVGHIDIPALIRDRDQLFAEVMAKGRTDSKLLEEARDPAVWQVMWGDRPISEGLGAWVSLKLDPALWDDAAVEQIEREVPDPLADVLSTLYDDVIEHRGRFSVLSGDDAFGGEDWKAVQGRDYVRAKDHVWVSAAQVLKYASLNPNTGGRDRRMATAMAKLGWKRVKRNGIRGYIHSR